MHAVVHSATFNDRSAAEADLDHIVSGGAGYWVASLANAGVAAVMFDFEEAAKGFVSS